MNLMAPINSLDELKELILFGVDEVYCGVLSESWCKLYTNIASINRVDRSNGNLRNYQELYNIVEYAHCYNVKVYLALNGLYTQAQWETLDEELDIILESGIDGLIVADLGLLNLLYKRKINKEIHASTGFTVFNSEAVKFLAEFGVSRIILPRDLTRQEICDIVNANTGIQFEVFVMNGRCKNIDGFCTFQHGISDLYSAGINHFLVSSRLGYVFQEVVVKLPLWLQKKAMEIAGAKVCSTACSFRYRTSSKKGINSFADFAPDFMADIFSCAGCEIYDFLKWGIKSVKIVGRTFSLQKKIKDVIFIKQLIKKAESDDILSADAFKDFSTELYKEVYGKSCKNNCYY